MGCSAQPPEKLEVLQGRFGLLEDFLPLYDHCVCGDDEGLPIHGSRARVGIKCAQQGLRLAAGAGGYVRSHGGVVVLVQSGLIERGCDLGELEARDALQNLTPSGRLRSQDDRVPMKPLDVQHRAWPGLGQQPFSTRSHQLGVGRNQFLAPLSMAGCETA